MRKTMTKIFALVLVCAMIIGFVAMIPAQAAPSVEIYANNVGFAEKLHMMYAIDASSISGYDEVVINLTDEDGNSLGVANRTGTQSIKGTEYAIFTAEQGIAVQDIAIDVYAEVEADGDVVATGRRSVLEYLYSQLLTNAAITAEQKAMYEGLLAYAGALQTVLMGQSEPVDCKDITKYSYVKVENGTIDGTYAAGMVEANTTLANLTASIVAGANEEVIFTVTEYDNAGEAGTPVVMTEAEAKALVVKADTHLILVASTREVGAEEPEIIANGNFIIVANNNAAMGIVLNSGKRIDGVAVNVYNGAVTTEGAPEWTVTNTTGGVTLHNGTQYLAYSGSSTTFALSDDEFVWSVELGDNGEIYLNIPAEEGQTARGLLYRDGTNNVFGAYALSNAEDAGYHRAMLFLVYEKCNHVGNLVNDEEPTCTKPGYSGDTVCTVCGALVAPGEEIPVVDHNFVDGFCTECETPDPDAGTGSTPRYVKVTSMDDLTSGTYVIVYNSSGDRALTTYNNKWVLNTTAPTVTNGEIAIGNVSANMKWTLTVSGSTVVMTDSNGATIKPSSETANGLGTDSGNAYAWTVAFANGTFTFSGKQGSVMLAANAQSSHNVRAYKNSTANGYPHTFTLYKLVED